MATVRVHVKHDKKDCEHIPPFDRMWNDRLPLLARRQFRAFAAWTHGAARQTDAAVAGPDAVQVARSAP
ncbi:hypothetical protein [Burkholderia lata]|uniref:hypothetical protein n=1 Tax=Burkholderia lata (strain ATCC 17760 / DSM 23089 / LMG 22485 / NCIMB 9086 / R18194 / 383) TaxID=482957 RepID=UPI0039994FBF